MHQDHRQSVKPSSGGARNRTSKPARDWLLYLEATFIGALTIGPLALMLWSLIARLF